MSKRKAYRAKPRNTNPLAPLVPMGKARAAQCTLAFYTALNSIIAGRHPGPAEWRDIADCLNVCERLVRRGSAKASDVMPLVDAASDGMKDAAHAFEKTGRMSLALPATLALQRLLEIHENFLETFPEREVLLVIAETRADIIEARKRAHVVTL